MTDKLLGVLQGAILGIAMLLVILLAGAIGWWVTSLLIDLLTEGSC